MNDPKSELDEVRAKLAGLLQDQEQRRLAGGTGRYSTARGDASQIMLGFNEAGGVNLRFEVRGTR